MAELSEFEKIIARLEKIVAELEKGGKTLAENLGLFEEGVELSHQAQELLRQAEGRTQILVRKLEEGWEAEDFASEGEKEEEDADE
jgi:exodeoxyribonuclease VII small subunit